MKTILSLITGIIILSSNVNGFIEECKLDKETCLQKNEVCIVHSDYYVPRGGGSNYHDE